jgi:hypothetical protein
MLTNQPRWFSQKDSSLKIFRPKLYMDLLSPTHTMYPVNLISLIALITYGEEYKLCNLFDPCYCRFLMSKILLITLFSNTMQYLKQVL